MLRTDEFHFHPHEKAYEAPIKNLHPIFKNISLIEDLHVENKNVFLRLDLNIPFSKGNKEKQIAQNLRIKMSIPTIENLLERKAKIVIGAHLGRPQTKKDQQNLSLEPIAKVLSECLKKDVLFVEDPLSPALKVLLQSLKSDQIIMLENLRFNSSEIKNDSHFAKKLSETVDIYINDAFGVSHRKHASIFELPQNMREKGMGFLMKQEIEMLNKILLDNNHQSSFLLILGGRKVKDKINLIQKLMERKETRLILGGAMAYTFLSAKGVFMNPPLVEKSKVNYAKKLLHHLKRKGKKVLLPLDHKIIPYDKEGKITEKHLIRVTEGPQIPEGFKGVDIGPKTIQAYKEEIDKVKLIFWNGPMGIFEIEGFEEGTFKMIEALSKSEAFTMIGGGDSARAVQDSHFEDKINYISTGGGASLTYLEKSTLPGIEALRKKHRSS